MSRYLFFLKNKVAIHVDFDGIDFYAEKFQLLEQGFEMSGDMVEAKTVAEAYELYKQRYGEVDVEYPMINALANIPQVVAWHTIFRG
ncbi:hypothetical protein [Enterovibrio nigricans]|uniref:Uncharacterized protein n=1 Tax=Enterovibrio nigricans DSM 22720 TaxID=1121868 RepID=A0A1T4UHN1_9GAMM|nr:hypothetical protein [Enterovibrio nigricans]PKF49959.1 hypothetical protein AT251_15000 [Enterovibrio nigricans]SKA52199.1 hypothetical protein SAMN02745132_01766 [Enterovibrio nigricans DSM 22720]